MALTPTLLTATADDTDANSYTTVSLSFVAGRYYVFGVASSASGVSPNTPTVSGATSGTWTALNGILFNTVAAARTRVGSYGFYATTSFSETLSVTFAGQTQLGLVYVCLQWADVPSSGQVVQTRTGRGDAGTSASTGALASFADATNNAAFMVAAADTAVTWTADSGWTKLGEVAGSAPAHSIAHFYRIGEDTTPTATLTSGDWGAMSGELEFEASGGFSVNGVSGARTIGWRRHRSAAW